eukprot:gnl/TRDRNA2_/TRDRNA2_175940_c1_seq5.p1 gnl/TRDRNA2_/TRDRNA2_175940_c1~~gnl/TRDRNA2_/TRDRNA2_175940_c1_seq5.p1  ORF type:complete len:628 (-),score=147.21 gnl/TRDRNA2_/TRDRNA2_175940_c1_seq5:126-1898(-)
MATMEVRIDALEGQTAPSDTFVSMRVGDVQKQSRFAASRTYRFPDPGDGRGSYGRIEVFKRIGAMTVHFDEGEDQDVVVPCGGDAELEKLDLKVYVKNVGMETTMKKKKAAVSFDETKQYLADHRLEELLADAMREVVKGKPKDPHTFLSSHILKKALPPLSKDVTMVPSKMPDRPSGGKKTLPPLEAAPAPPLPMKSAEGQDALQEQIVQAREQLAKAASDGSVGRALREALGDSEAKKAIDAVPTTRAAPTTAFSHSVLPGHLPKVIDYKSFTDRPVTGPYGGTLPKEWSWSGVPEHLPKVVDYSKFTDKPVSGPYGGAVPKQWSWSGVPPHLPTVIDYSKFTQRPVAGPYGGAAQSAAAAAPAPTTDVKKLPSVGSWYSPLRDSTEAAKPDFRKLASVGSWLTPLPAGAAAGASAAAATAKPAEEVMPPKMPFKRAPSVGTWLCKTPVQVARPWYFQAPQEKDISQENVVALQGVIGEKERELDELRKMMERMAASNPVLAAELAKLDEKKAASQPPSPSKSQAPSKAQPPPTPKADMNVLKGKAQDALINVLLGEASASKKEEPPFKANWKHKASVGTWLAPVPLR